MINITFPDKSIRKYDSSITGYDLAKSISNSLAKNAICIEINGELRDLSYLIENDAMEGWERGGISAREIARKQDNNSKN